MQQRFGCVSPDAIDGIARACKMPRSRSRASCRFPFLSQKTKGQVVVRLCTTSSTRCTAARAWRGVPQELGIDFGQTTADGKITLEWTPCIGMCDQAPAAILNDVIVTKLHSDDVKRIVGELRQHMDPDRS